jgi:hypothetical protein
MKWRSSGYKSGDGDSMSINTETTTSYDKIHSFLMSLQQEDGDVTTGSNGTTLARLLQRQLSGDPSKINPNLNLNQQANNLAYNTKLEIDRCNFKVGKLLGSGHFGSVYMGEASGILHPGE